MRYFIIAVLSIFALQLAYYFPKLPEVMATHFNASGTADGWSTREVFYIVYFSSLLLIYGCLVLLPTKLMNRASQHLSIPNKDKLSPEQIEYFKGFMAYMLKSMGVLTAVLVVYVMQLCINANLTANPELSGTFWWAFVPYILFTIGWTVVVIKKSFSLANKTNLPQ